jgi:hypothetical protein
MENEAAGYAEERRDYRLPAEYSTPLEIYLYDLMLKSRKN